MKRIKLISLVGVILVAGLLVSCGTATPTKAPVSGTTGTCPTAVTCPPAAPAAAKWCSGVRIVFFPGGPEGGVFAVNVYNGARQAEADLGPKVDYLWSDWNVQTMIQQFSEAAATKPDGIAVMGHPGDEAFDPLIDDARSKGIM